MESSSSSSSSSSSFMKTCEENSRLSSPGALQRSCLFSSFSPAFERRGETPRLLTSSMEAAQTEETTMKEEEEKREGLSPSSCSSSGQCVSGTPSMNKPSVSLREKMKSRMKFLCSLSSFFSHLRQGVHTLGDWVHCTYTRIWMKSVLPLQLYLANHHCLLIYCLLFVGRLVEFTFHFTACLVPAFFYVYFSMFLHLLSSPSPSSPQEIPRDSQLALRRSQRIHIDASSHREREEEARLSRSSRVVFERFSRGQGEGNSSSFGGGGEEGERRGGSSFFFSSEEDFIDASIPSSSTATSGEKWIFLSLTSLYIILSHAFHGLLVEVPLYTFALYFSQLLHLQSLSFSLSPKCRLEFSSSSSSSAYPSSSYAARSTTTTSETGDENGRDTPFFSSSSSSSDRIVTSSSSSSSFSPLSVVMEEREGEGEEEEEEEEESSLLISPSVVGRDADHAPCEEEAGGDEREKEKKGVSCSVDLHASENEAPKSLLSLSSETTMKREEEDEEKKKDKKREDGGAVDKERSCTEEEEERIEQEGEEEVSKERGEVGYLKKKRQDDRKSLSSCLPSNSARSSSSPSSAFLSPRLDVVDRKDDANASGDVISSSFSLSSSSSSVFQDEGVRLRHRGRRREEDKDEEIEEGDPSLGCHSLSSSLPVGLLLSSRKRRERREKEKEEEKPEKTPPERNGASLERIGTCHVSSFFPLPSPLRLQAAFPSREKKDQEEFVSSTEMCDLRQEASRAFSSSSSSSRSRLGINSSSAPPALSPLSQTDRRERRDSFSEQCISMTACSSGYQDAAEEDRRGEDEGEQDENEEGGDLFFAKMKIRGLSLLFFIHSAALFLLSKLTSMVSSSPSSSPPSSSPSPSSSSSHDSRSATSFLLSLFSRRRMSEETRRRRERDDGGRSDSSLSFFFLHLLFSCTQHLFTFVSFLSSFFSFCGCFISSQLSRFLSFLRGLFIFFLITLPSSKGRHLFSNVKAGLRDIFSFLSLHRGLFIHRCPFFKRERWERRWRRLRHSLHPFRLLSISPLFLFPNASHRLFFLTFFFWLIRSLHFHSYYSSLRQGGEDEDLVTFLRETEEEMGGNRFLLHVASQGGEGVVEEEESLRQLLSAEVGGEGGDEGLLISSQLFAFPEVDEEEEEEEEGEKKNEEGKKRRRMRRQLTSMLEKKKKMKASAIDNNDEESQGGIESRGDPRKEEEKKKKKSGEEEGLNRIEDEEEFIVSSSDQIDQSSSSSTRRRSDMRLSHSSSSSVDEGKKDMKKSQTENGVLPEEEEDEREEENARDRKEKENEETLIKKKKKKKKKDLHDDHSSWSISRLLSTCFSHNFSSSSPAPRLSPSTPSPSSSSSFPFSLFPFFFRDPHDHLASPFTRRLLLHLHQQHGAPPSLSPSPHLLSSSSSSARGKIEETIMTWGAVLLFLLVLSYFLLGILSSLGLLPFQLLHTLLILRYTHVTTYSRFREEETKRRRREKEEEEKKKEDERRRKKSRRTRDKEEDVFSRSQGEGVACLEETGKEGGRCGQSVAERKIEKEEMERMATSHDKEKEGEEGINEEEEEISGREGMKKLLDQEEESEGERREELSSSSHPADTIQEEDEEDEDMCIFCFEEFQPLDILRVVTPCRHKFHRECIDAWFFKRERDTCPMCGPIQIRSTTSYNIPP